MATTFSTVDSPPVRYIADVLEDKIRSGEYKSGEWLPSERALAEEFRVSRVIIREAMKAVEDRNLIVRSARCRPMVRGVVGVGSREAGSRPTRRRTIALLIWPNPNWPGSAMIVHGIRQVLNQDHYRLVLESALGDTWEEIQESEARFLRQITHDQDIDGLILWYLGGERNIPALQSVREAGVPMVFLDRQPPAGFHADYVGVDNVRSAEQVVKYLLSLGHRSIAHVSNMDTVSTVEERFEGYRRALTRAGVPFRRELVRHDAGNSHDADTASAGGIVDELMALPEPPTAIFAVNDIVAHHFVRALRERSYGVPEDVSVVGFDGIELSGPGTPFLTTVDQPFERIGGAAADILSDRIEEGATPTMSATSPYRHIVLDAPFTVRGSTARR